ncbi:hypothetical protein IWQ62_002364 [Dispira parvispora]|uniref:Non-specific serine/threonine protein kinase n=1 Tax=Dispira parvispora TaxID=1520584 RepID=A0A9W8E786_9FUNG|nr:hypothetical protein IWQ62_002364 [Dispira parvispora]
MANRDPLRRLFGTKNPSPPTSDPILTRNTSQPFASLRPPPDASHRYRAHIAGGDADHNNVWQDTPKDRPTPALFSQGFHERLTRFRPSLHGVQHKSAQPCAFPQSTEDSLPTHPPVDPQGSIQDYQLYQCIGSGAFGQVFLARARCGPLQGQWVAIKRVDKHQLHTAELRVRLVKEVELHWKTRHPHLVLLHDYFEDLRYVYLVLELCRQGELFRYLRHGLQRPLRESEARGLLLPLVQVLEYLHGQGILHRDLKLSNILLTDTMQVKLCDFGLATQYDPDDRGTEPKTMCGTPNYISPEIWARQAYGPPSDMWSLGCLFISFVMGKVPFSGGPRHDNFQTGAYYPQADAIDEESLDQLWASLPSSLSYEATSMVRGLLKLNPRNRLTAYQLLHHPFFAPDLPVESLPYLRAVAHTPPSRPESDGRLYDASQPLPGSYSGGAGNGYDQGTDRADGLAAVYQAIGQGNHEQRDVPVFQGGKRPAHGADRQGSFSPVSRRRPLSYRNQVDDRNPPFTARQPPLARNTEALSDTRRRRVSPTANRHPPPPESLLSTKVAQAEPSAFSTARLRPIRKDFKQAMFEIRPDGKVVAHFTGERHVLLFNARGTKLYLFARQDVSLSGKSASFQQGNPVARYHTSDLPSKYTKQYEFVSRLIRVVQSKTIRISLNTPQAKCLYMEDRPYGSMTVKFYNGITIQVSCVNRVVEFQVPQKDLPNSIHKFTLPESKPEKGAPDTLAADPSDAMDWSLSRVSPDDKPSADGADRTDYDPLQLQSIRGELPEFLRPLLRYVIQCYQQCLAIDVELSTVENNLSNTKLGSESTLKYPIEVRLSDLSQRVDVLRVLVDHGLKLDQDLSAADPLFSKLTRGQRTGSSPTEQDEPTGQLTWVLPASSARQHQRYPRDLKTTTRERALPTRSHTNDLGFYPPPTSTLLPPPPSQSSSRTVLSNPPPSRFPGVSFKSHFIPDVGWCMLTTSNPSAGLTAPHQADPIHDGQPRFFMIFFIDGIALIIDVLERTVQWVDQAQPINSDAQRESASGTLYPIDHNLPTHIKDRLEYFPSFQRGLDLPHSKLL